MNHALLIELGCEDLPARYVGPLSDALREGIAGGLTKRKVALGSARTFATPRRIAVLIEQVADRQPDQSVERRGPALAAAYKDGQPTPAALGFAKSCGVAFEQLEKLETDKGGWLVFRSTQKGRKTTELIPEIFEETLKSMDELVPKRMRWGGGEETFVRPVQWIVCMLGAKVIPLKRFGLKAGNKTQGHRFHAPKAIALKSPAEYEEKLQVAKVWADFASRKSEIRQQIETEAQKLKGVARITDELLDEVTALVEWPVAIHGRMEERFMQLPSEVIISTIEHNQRYFPVFGDNGRLMPLFITVSNIQSKDVQQVIAGNERVVRPRLSDALFFWEQDRKKKLAEFVPALDQVTFQKDLGSTGAKVRRIGPLAAHIAAAVGEAPAPAARAAELCKADLLTRMVYEFPELQGVMGGYYATAGGEPPEVAQAIREHYQPTQAGGALPSTRCGQLVALADKLDTLAGIFAIGGKPSASKDPFGLRRAAVGALRICMEDELPLDLRAVLKRALEAQPAGKRDEGTLLELWEFVSERMEAVFEMGVYGRDYEFFSERLAAIRATGTTNPLDFKRRFVALSNELDDNPAGFSKLAAAHKRIRNILKQAGEGDIEIRPDHFREAEERGLFEALKRLDGAVQSAADQADYTGGLRALAQLQAPVDAFFDKVMVLAPEQDLRANRVALLRRLDRLCRSIADISCLPG